MFNTFVKALIPALAFGRGNADGTSYENASVIDGVNPSNNFSVLQQQTQYWFDLDSTGEPVMHGESYFWLKASRAPFYAQGFCMQISSADKTWDCLRIYSKIETKKDSAGKFIKNTDTDQFKIDDLIYTGDISSAPVLKWAAWSKGIKSDKQNNFTLEPAGSFSMCEGDAAKVTCPKGTPGESGVTVRWSRPFDTKDAEDTLLKLSAAGESTKAFNFVVSWDSEPDTEALNADQPDHWDYNWNPTNLVFVTKAFANKVESDKLQPIADAWKLEQSGKLDLIINHPESELIPNPDPNEWTITVGDIPGSTYPPFLEHDINTNKLTMSPDKAEQVDKPYAFAVTLESSSKTVKVTAEIQVLVHDAKKWGWTVTLTDRLGSSGHIEFDHDVDMSWLENNFADLFSWVLTEGSQVVNDEITVTATKFDSDAAKPKRVVEFKVTEYDFKKYVLTMKVANDYQGLDKFFIRPTEIKDDVALEFGNLEAKVIIPPTDLTFLVTITDLEKGKGNMKFSHPVDMVWLEANYLSIFNIKVVTDDEKDEIDADIEVTAWDSKDDDMEVDFTFTTFDMDKYTMYWTVSDQFNYNNLFVLSASDVGFVLKSEEVTAIKKADGGIVEKGEGNKEDTDVDDDDSDDGPLIGGIIGGIIGAILICVLVYCCCIWCKKRKAQEGEKQQKQVQMKKTGDADKSNKDGDRSTSALAQNNK